jgi:hypothetical protein
MQVVKTVSSAVKVLIATRLYKSCDLWNSSWVSKAPANAQGKTYP